MISIHGFYFVKNSSIIFKFNFSSKTITAAIDKYGPKGNTLLLFFIKLIMESGRAIKDAMNIVTIDISNPSVSPIKNNSLINKV